jgi:hypothetical protein
MHPTANRSYLCGMAARLTLHEQHLAARPPTTPMPNAEPAVVFRYRNATNDGG